MCLSPRLGGAALLAPGPDLSLTSSHPRLLFKGERPQRTR